MFYVFGILILLNSVISFGRFTRIARAFKIDRYQQIFMLHDESLFTDKWYLRKFEEKNKNKK